MKICTCSFGFKMQGTIPLGRPSRKWEDNVSCGLGEIVLKMWIRSD
jgi:hypothetical protein